jgi:hypothetical protein
MPGRRVTVRHGKFFDGLRPGMEGGSIVAVSSTGIIDAENGNEELEFTLVNKCINGSSKGNIIGNGRAKSNWGYKERGGVQKSGIKATLESKKSRLP